MRFWDSGFSFRVPGFVSRASGFVFRDTGFGFQVSGFGFRACYVSGFGFRVPSSGFCAPGFGHPTSRTQLMRTATSSPMYSTSMCAVHSMTNDLVEGVVFKGRQRGGELRYLER